jgi:hypothetical protein
MQLIFLQITLLVVGIVVGTFVRGVEAQTDPSLFKVGQRLTLAFPGDRFAEGNVAEIRGLLVRFDDSKIQWFNVGNAISVTVR